MAHSEWFDKGASRQGVFGDTITQNKGILDCLARRLRVMLRSDIPGSVRD